MINQVTIFLPTYSLLTPKSTHTSERVNNEKRFFSSKRVFFSNLTIGSFSINSFFNSRLQKYSITTIHHDGNHDFFLSFGRVPVSINSLFYFLNKYAYVGNNIIKLIAFLNFRL